MKININKINITGFISLILFLYMNHLWLFIGTPSEVTSKISGKIFVSVLNLYNPLLDSQFNVLIHWDKFLFSLGLSIFSGIIITLYLYNRLKYIQFTTKDSTVDKIFVLIFIFMLLIPAIYLNPNTRSNHEARNFATYHPLYNFETKRINKEYGKNLSDFLNDRFFGRIYLIYMNREIIHKLSLHYARFGSRIIDKHQKKMFNYWTAPIFTDDTANEINTALKEYNDYCKKNNSKLFVLITPNQNSIYKIDAVKRDINTNIKYFISSLTKDNDVKLIFPLDELLKNNKPDQERVYFYTDHHTTDDGTFIVYRELLKSVQKEFQNIKPLTKDDFTYFYNNEIRAERQRSFSVGQTCRLIGLTIPTCEKYLDYQYRYFTHKNHLLLNKKDIDEKYLLANTYHYPKGANYKVLVFGDSSIENLMEFLPYTFKDVYKIRLNGPLSLSENERYKLVKYYDEEFKKFKPDIVIVSYGYTAIRNLQTISAKD